jgi:uncharacterized membrane protein
MKAVSSILLVACLVGAIFVQPAQAQPRPGGGPGGGGPGGGGPGGGGPGGGGPGGPSPTFTLAICNKSASPEIYIAVASLSGQKFRAQGWWKVGGNQCTTIGNFQRPGVFAIGADTRGTTWGESNVTLCVNRNGPFDYTWDGNARSCGPGEDVMGFQKLEVEPRSPGFTWTLND